MKSPTKIILQNGAVLTIQKDGKLDTVPATTYNLMKIGDFEGNQIFYTFEDLKSQDGKFIGKKVEETFDHGIFNCYVADEEIQLRDGELVAQAINEHRETGNTTILKRIFMKEMDQSYSEKAVAEFLEPFVKTGRIKKINEGYLIDKRFVMDQHAVAKQWKNDTWTKVCIVVQNDIVPFEIDSPFGMVEVSEKAVEILSKIIFLLKPNTGDDVFMDQLLPDLRQQLIRDFPPPPPNCERISDWQEDEDGFKSNCTGQMLDEDSLTELKVCNICKLPSQKDKAKYDKEHKPLAVLPDGVVPLDMFSGEKDDTPESDNTS